MKAVQQKEVCGQSASRDATMITQNMVKSTSISDCLKLNAVPCRIIKPSLVFRTQKVTEPGYQITEVDVRSYEEQETRLRPGRRTSIHMQFPGYTLHVHKEIELQPFSYIATLMVIKFSSVAPSIPSLRARYWPLSQLLTAVE